MAKELKNLNFYCPITDEIMRDPVIDYEGNSYERAAIEEWLRLNGTSPITRSPLNISQLVPNRSLRKAIEDELLLNEDQAESKTQSPPSGESKRCDISEVQKSISLTMTSKDNLLLLSALPSEDDTRGPVDIVCVVDVSGSMGESAIIKGNEDNGLSVLDIVKHALKTIVVMLSENDRFALVTYSNEARVVFSLTPLNPPGRARVTRLIDQLSAGGMTNLWDGLEKGLDVLTTDHLKQEMRNSAIFLLTDGIPNVDPPRGYVHRLRRYKDSHGGVYPGVISTFGFGYSLKSTLLKEIAVEGDGMYMFIPDSGFVGTAFVNALSNQLVSICCQATIELTALNGIRIRDDDLSHLSLIKSISKDQDQVRIHVGTLQSGQSRNFLLECHRPENMSNEDFLQSFRFKLEYTPYGTDTRRDQQEIYCTEITETSTQLLEIDVQRFRNRLIYFLHTNSRLSNNAASPSDSILANEMREWLTDHPKSRRGNGANDILHDRVEGMLLDITGQITEAITRNDYFTKWGIHYLPSLQRAHELEQCTNFKDPGVQHYGGHLFHMTAERADELFCTLPPPLPSRQTLQNNSSAMQSGRQMSSSSSQVRSVPDMSMYHCASAPCFHGSCLVTMADGTLKRVDKINKGDIVICPSSTRSNSSQSTIVAKVESILRTYSKVGTMKLIRFEEGLLVTPWHPIKYDNEWTFPANLHESKSASTYFESIETEAVYSFLLGPEMEFGSLKRLNDDLLERGQAMLINGIECITLAHGISNDAIATHPFYGTERIVHEMGRNTSIEELPHYVDLMEGDVIKDPITHLTIGLRFQSSYYSE